MNNELAVLMDYIRDELGHQGELDPDVDLLKEQILDSFSVVQLAVHIQDAFEVELEPEDLVRENLSTLSNILSLIERRRVGTTTP